MHPSFLFSALDYNKYIKMKPFGIHIISEFSGCKIDLNDKKLLETIVKAGITKCGFGLRSLVSYQFKPIGTTIAAIISQSHIVIHTFPEATRMQTRLR